MVKNVYRSLPAGPRLIINGQPTQLAGRTVLESLQHRIKESEDKLKAISTKIAQKKGEFDEISVQMIQEAQCRADQIVTEAKAKADEIIKSAAKEKEAVLEKARVQGAQAGEEAGFKEANKKAMALINQAEKVLLEAQHKRDEIIKGAEAEIIELVILLSEKVIKTDLTQNKEVVLGNVSAAVKRITGEGEITVKVNPANLSLAESRKEEFIAGLSGIEGIKVKVDPTITSGGCKIETNFGIIDARIESQLDQLAEGLREAIGEERVEN
ncbi:MAG: FliH/SctL family protein [bacterium]|nr:FliH/SctL family protein [bacterium]